MRIKISHLAIIAATALSTISWASAQQLKVGIVDMNKAFTEYYKTKDAEARLNTDREAAKQELEGRMETLRKAMEEINKMNAEIEKPELSARAKEEKTKQRDTKIADARTLDREIVEFRQTKERQLQERFFRLRKDIIDEIMKIVDTKVKASGFDLVLDKSGLSMGQVPVVLYSRTDMEFTNDIITELNKSAPKVKPTE